MFGDILKNLRIEKNIKQKELADIIHTSPVMISNYENNINIPGDYKTLIELANFFEVTVDFLIGNEKTKTLKKELIDEEIKLIEMFRELPKEDKKEALKYIKFRLQENDENKKLSSFQKNKKKEA